jgi:hypothetical protein
MPRKQITLTALVALLLLLSAAAGLADSDPGELECIPEQPSGLYPGGDEPSSKGSPGVPRNQILLEVFMRPT